LTAIVAIGVAFFVGVSGTSPVMGHSVDQYDDDTKLKDITIYSNYGFDEEDLDAIRNVEGVALAEGAYFADVLGTYENSTYITRIHSYNENNVINRIVLRTGRMPRNKNEALAENGTTLEQGFPLGSKVTFAYPEGTENDSLLISEVTVVGTIDTPLYLNLTKENSTLSNQYIRTYLYVPEDAFDQSFYLEVNALIEGGVDLYSFGEEYEKLSDRTKENIETLAVTQQNHRVDSIKEEAMEEYNEGLQQYEDGKKEFEEGIRDGENELAEGQEEIDDGERQLSDAEKALQEAKKLLETSEKDARQKLKDAEEEINKGWKELDTQSKAFEEKKKELGKQKQDLLDAIPQLEQAKDGLRQIDEGIDQIDQGLKQLKDPYLEALMRVISYIPEDTKLEDIQNLVNEIIDLRNTLQERYPDLAETDVQDLIDKAINDTENASDVYDYLNSDIVKEEAEYLRTLDEETAMDDEALASLTQVSEIEKIIREWLPGFQFETVGQFLETYDLLTNVLHDIDEFLNRDIIQDLLYLYHAADEETKQKMMDLDFSSFSNQMDQFSELSGVSPIETIGDILEAYARSISKLEETKADLVNKRKEITDALEKQGIHENEIDEAIEKMKDGIRQIDEGIAQGEKLIEEGRKKLEDARKQLEDGKKQLEEQLKEARKQYENGAAEIARNKAKLEDAKSQLADGLKELEEARQKGLEELEEAWQKLVDAKKQIDDLKPGEWTILNRKSHYASVTYANTVDQMKAIGRIFPVFFILVAALVCLTTMTRMVDEQRGEIGILRALGYSRLQCAGKYLIYAAAATITGTIIGIVLGLSSFPIIIYNTWKLMYILPPVQLIIPWNLIFMSSLSFLGGMLLTTWLACRADMKEVPSQLMRPKAPKLGKNTVLERIKFIWNRLSFTWKVTLRNIIRYKRRFFMTVSGVAGCTALLVTGFGIRDSINSMVDIQFYQIYQYDGMANFEKNADEERMEEVLHEYRNRDEIAHAMLLKLYSAKATGNSELEDTVTVETYVNPEDVAEAYDLRTRTKHDPVTINDDGAVISEKLAERLEIGIGDTIHLEGADGTYRDIPVTGITEMYIGHYAFMTEKGYEKYYGYLPNTVSMLVKINGDQQTNRKIQSELVDLEGIDGITFYDVTLDNFNNMVKGLNVIVWTLIVSSMSLAFVVLGNLINVNISERQREIATLKVLGFRKKEVQSYIYKENNVLTLIGSFVGLPVGTMLHHYIMRMVEMEYVMFGRAVLPLSYVYAIGLTVLFGILVDRFMAKRLTAIQMVESLKSVE